MQTNNQTEYSIETKIFTCLRKIISAVDTYAMKLKEKTGLNASQLSCLLVLAKTGSMPLSSLSRKVAVSPSMITLLVDQLEKKELVYRSRKSADRRVILIELTEQGKEVVKTAPPLFQEKLLSSLEYLEAEEKKRIHDTLSQFLSIILSEVLIESSLLGLEDKLVEVSPTILKSKIEKK